MSDLQNELKREFMSLERRPWRTDPRKHVNVPGPDGASLKENPNFVGFVRIDLERRPHVEWSPVFQQAIGLGLSYAKTCYEDEWMIVSTPVFDVIRWFDWVPQAKPLPAGSGTRYIGCLKKTDCRLFVCRDVVFQGDTCAYFAVGARKLYTGIHIHGIHTLNNE